MNAGKKLTKIFSLAAVIALALAFVGKDATWVQAQDDDRRTVSIPLGSTGLTFGEGLRITLTNLGARRINAQTRVTDAGGIVVKQESLVLEPGEMRSFEMSRSEVGRDEPSVILRTEVVTRRADGRNLWMTSEVIDWSTGSTRFQMASSRCPDWFCTGGGNHNETLVRETAPRTDSQVGS